MFNLTTTVRSPYQALAMLVSVAVLLWSVGAYTTAQAANLVELSNTLTDSAPSATAGHSIEFTVPAGSDITGDIDITFPVEFTDVGTVVDGGVTVTGGAGTKSASASGQVVTVSGITANASDTLIIDIAAGVITNPSATGSYEITVDTVTTAGTDNGATRVAIVDTVTVTAAVETTFDFIISGVATSTLVDATNTTTGSTTATEIPFGILAAGTPKIMAQDLSVTTNAANGFVVTVEQDQNLLSATGADIDTFIDGADTNSPATWAPPTANVNNEDTWGHWGVRSNDSNLEADLGTPGNRDFTTDDQYVAVQTGTPVEVFAHVDPSDGSTQDIGTARVGYKIEVSALQEAANDYTTTLTYIATPTF
jgi:hypothetical protein